jgi:hypothetical protein
MRRAGYVVYMKRCEILYTRNPKRRRPLGRPRRRWENNIKMDQREIGWESVNWMHLAQDRD